VKTRIAIAVLLFTSCKQAPPAAPERRVEVPLDVVLESDYGPAVALSPDASTLALAGSQLYVRRVNDPKSTPLFGTDGARSPFFSPDGAWIAFFTASQLKKVPVGGGEVVTLCDEEAARGGAWSADGDIIFATIHGGLWSVPAAGGKPVRLTSLNRDDGETTQRWPQVLSGGRVLLYTASSSTESFEDAHAVLQDLRSGWRRVVHRGGYHYRYLTGGHLVFVSQGFLKQLPIDLNRFEKTGTPSPVAENILALWHNGGAQIAVSDNGTLLYVPSPVTGKQSINWLGSSKPLRAAADYYYGLALSPDGRHAAFGLSNGVQSSVNVYDWERDKLTHLADTTGASAPIWTSDGKRVTYANASGIVWQNADGSGVATLLRSPGGTRFPESWHPSGKYLAFREYNSQYANDIFILEMKDGKPGNVQRLIGGPNNEMDAAFSPDGRWIAYAANDPSGKYKIYARTFPADAVPFLITPKGGGTLPTWSKDGRELMYRGLDGRIMEVDYTANSKIIGYSEPHALSERIAVDLARVRSYDQAPDGRVALLESIPQTNPGKAVLVYNFNSSPGR
jgi:serine/threonine-protein kinase